MISAVVLTRNEEKNLERCLNSLKWFDETLVVDDFSTDRTVELAEKFGAKVFKKKLNNDYASSRNFGLQKATGEWVFFVDADEEVTENLKKEIKEVLLLTKANGFYLKRDYFLFGRWLKHGETASVKVLRLGRRGAGEWQRKVDEIWKINGETKILKTPLSHFPHPTLKEFLEHLNDHSTINARVFYNHDKRLNFLEWSKPILKFIQNYFLRLGFLDGTAGFLMATLMSFHSFLVRAKLYLIWKNEGGWR